MPVNYFANNFSLMPNSSSVADVLALDKAKYNPGGLVNDLLTDIVKFRQDDRANNVKDIIGRTIASGGSLADANNLVDAMGYSVNDKARAKMQEFANTAMAEQRKADAHIYDLAFKQAQTDNYNALTQKTIDENTRAQDKHGLNLEKLRLDNIGLGLSNTRKAIDIDQTNWLNAKTRRDDAESREVAGFMEKLADVSSYGKEATLEYLASEEVQKRLVQNPLLQKQLTTFMTNKGWDRIGTEEIKPIETTWKATPEIVHSLPSYETSSSELGSIMKNSIYQGAYDDKFESVDKYTDHLFEMAALTEQGKKNPDVSGDRKLKIKKDLNDLIKGVGAQIYQETGIRLPEREIIGIIDRNFDPSQIMNPLADTRVSFDREGALSNAKALATTRDTVLPFLNEASKHISGIQGSKDKLLEYNTEMDNIQNLIANYKKKYPNRSKEHYDKVASNIIKNTQSKYKDLWEAIDYFRGTDPLKTLRSLVPEDTKVTPKTVKKTEAQNKEEYLRELVRKRLNEMNASQPYVYDLIP